MRKRDFGILTTCGAVAALSVMVSSVSVAQAPPAPASNPLPVIAPSLPPVYVVNLATPVQIAANTLYVVSYHTSNGQYAVTQNAFTSAGLDSGVLHAPSSPASAGNGVYRYSPTSAFPSSSYLGSNYWVDVVFTQN